jgi:hypothetical protein
VLVDQIYGEQETAAQPLSEAPHLSCDRVIVGRRRDAHDESHRLPLAKQVCDGLEAAAIVLERDALQRVCDADRKIADGDTDALGAEVECENRAGISLHPDAAAVSPVLNASQA